MRTLNHASFAVPVPSSLDQFSREVDRLFSTMFQGLPAAPRVANFPPLNVWEEQENLVVEAELPGMTMEDLELTIHGDRLTLRGERKSASQGTPLRRERWTGKFERSFTLPVEVDNEKATATLTQGVLRIALPKAASARPRRIEIRTAG